MTEMNKNGIVQYLHCAKCMQEIPDGSVPALYQRVNVGFTVKGLQIWCVRHGINVLHVDFEGVKHPADLTAGKPEMPESVCKELR